MEQFDVFISHSSHDKAVADHICEMLEKNGITCWIAPRDIRPGQRYAIEIMRGLKSCLAMVLVFSKYSNRSQHVANELDHAFNENKPIIPFLIDETPFNDEFDYYLSRKQQLIAYPQYEDKLIDLAKAVAETLKKQLPKPIITSKEDRNAPTIPSKWLKQNPLKEGLSLVCNDSRRWGFVNDTDEEVIPCKWLGAKDFSEGLAAVRSKNGKWGFINMSGKEIGPSSWIKVGDFNDGLAPVQSDNRKWGYINKTGKVVIPCCWAKAENFANGRAQVSDDSGRIFTINKKGLFVAQG